MGPPRVMTGFAARAPALIAFYLFLILSFSLQGPALKQTEAVASGAPGEGRAHARVGIPNGE